MPNIAPGPLDELEWTTELTANVVAPTTPVRLHGFDVEGDLAMHYRFADVALAAMLGVVPDEASGAIIDVCLTFLSPAPVWEAPTNAASLARLSGSPAAGVLATGMVGLVEQARYEVAHHAEFLAWLDEPGAAIPAAFQTSDADERARVDRLRAAISKRAGDVALPAGAPTLMAAIIALLHGVGVRAPQQLMTLLVMAKVPCLAAEAFAGEPGRIGDYPLVVPAYRYVSDESESP